MATKRSTPEALLRKVFPPMLATLTDAPPASGDWAYELKYDGFRAVCAVVDGGIAMWSRNELDLEPRFPAVAAALSKLKVPDVVIDGEIVVLDEQGAPRFQLLQQGDRREILIVFDILWLDGEDLRRAKKHPRKDAEADAGRDQSVRKNHDVGRRSAGTGEEIGMGRDHRQA